MENNKEALTLKEQKPTTLSSTLEMVPRINSDLSEQEIIVNGKRIRVENILHAHDIYKERYESSLVINRRLAEIADKAKKENKIIKSEKESLEMKAFNKERSLAKELERSNKDRELFTKKMEQMYGDLMNQLENKNKEVVKLKEEKLKGFELTQINALKIKRLNNIIYDYDQSVKTFYNNDLRSSIPKSTVKFNVMLFKFRTMIKMMKDEFDIDGVIGKMREDSDIIALLRDELRTLKERFALCKSEHQGEIERLQTRHEILSKTTKEVNESQISNLNAELEKQKKDIKSKRIMIEYLTGIKQRFNKVNCERAVWERNCRLLAGKYQRLKELHGDDGYISDDGGNPGNRGLADIVVLKTHLESNILMQEELQKELADANQKNDNIKVQLDRKNDTVKQKEVENYLLKKEVQNLKLKLKEISENTHSHNLTKHCEKDAKDIHENHEGRKKTGFKEQNRKIEKPIPIKIYFLQSDQKDIFAQKKIQC